MATEATTTIMMAKVDPRVEEALDGDMFQWLWRCPSCLCRGGRALPLYSANWRNI
ncbi:hypothetical protein TIFTF001_002746 [Ficus carica]|uniref:Uncharacterized protein n=1 Tax=Ficus carica TaxID=3494 RepID=A0AA87ZW67_FICCA|nr:hypothetical protein TIFTF001_002746 [Ficus carica]